MNKCFYHHLNENHECTWFTCSVSWDLCVVEVKRAEMTNGCAEFHSEFFSRIVFLCPVFTRLPLSPLFSASPLFCYFTWRCRCERVRPWKNIGFCEAVEKESIDWPLHLGTQWQMASQFSAWLRGNKAHFHFHRSPARVQSCLSLPL